MRAGKLDLRLGGGQGEGLAGALKTLTAVLTVTEGLVSRQTTAAEADGGATGEIVGSAFGVDDGEVPLDADGAVVENRNFG